MELPSRRQPTRNSLDGPRWYLGAPLGLGCRTTPREDAPSGRKASTSTRCQAKHPSVLSDQRARPLTKDELAFAMGDINLQLFAPRDERETVDALIVRIIQFLKTGQSILKDKRIFKAYAEIQRGRGAQGRKGTGAQEHRGTGAQEHRGTRAQGPKGPEAQRR